MRTRPSSARRPFGRIAAVFAVVGALVLGSAVPAMAAPDGGVGIAPVTSADSPQTHKSGEPFEYDVAFQCSTVDPPETCKNVDVRIPLGDAKDFKIDTSKLPAGATAEVVDGVLVVQPWRC